MYISVVHKGSNQYSSLGRTSGTFAQQYSAQLIVGLKAKSVSIIGGYGSAYYPSNSLNPSGPVNGGGAVCVIREDDTVACWGMWDAAEKEY